MDLSAVRIGPQVLSDGTFTNPRGGKTGCAVGINGHGYYQELVYRQNVYSMVLAATSTGVAAGNIVSAAAAASTNFALFNPANSGKLLVLLKFGVGVVSGTPGAGPLFHGTISNVPTPAATGTILNNYVTGSVGSVAKGYATAAGTTLTAGNAPVTHMMSNFASTATAQASNFMVTTIDILDGQIIVPPGTGWLPLWSAAGTALLNGYSVTWEEIAL